MQKSDYSRETISNPVTREELTFIQTVGENGSKVTIVEIQVAARGKGPPMHYHSAFSEKFLGLEGEIMLKLESETICLREGQEVLVKPNQMHCFWSEMDRPVKFRGTIEPGSIDFENCFRITFGLARDGLVSRSGLPRRFSHLAILATMAQSNVQGPASAIIWLFGLLTRTKSFQQTQRELTRKYCPPGDR